GAVVGCGGGAGGGGANGRRRLERVLRTVVGEAVAALGHVTHAIRLPADGGALLVEGTVRAVAGAVLGNVALARGGPADHGGGGEAVERAVRAVAGAVLVTVTRAVT